MSRLVAREMALLFGFLFLANLIWAPANLGFVDSVVHPYILVILLVAARHGVAPSLVCTFVSIALVLIQSRYRFHYPDFQQNGDTLFLLDLLERPWNLRLASWMVLGASIGGLFEAGRKERDALLTKVTELNQELDDRRQRLEILESENVELREKVLGEGETISTVYEMARRLTTLEGRDLFQASLELVEQFVGATRCSVYLLDDQHKSFRRTEERGTPGSPDFANVARGDALFEKCLREGRVVSLRDLFSAERFRQVVPAVMAAPLGILGEQGSGSQAGVLLVESAPLESLNAQTVSVFELLGDWVSRALSLVQQFERAESDNPTVSLTDQLKRRRLTETTIQTLSRYAPTQRLAFRVLENAESPELALWNASQMLAFAIQTNDTASQAPLQKAIHSALSRDEELLGLLHGLPDRPDLTGCRGLRLRLEEREELCHQALLRLLKVYVSRFHGDLLPDFSRLRIEMDQERRRLDLDKILQSIPFLASERDSVLICLNIAEPPASGESEQGLLETLVKQADPWSRRFALLSLAELDLLEDRDAMTTMLASEDKLDREAGYLAAQLRDPSLMALWPDPE
jgi:GAF domain